MGESKTELSDKNKRSW